MGGRYRSTLFYMMMIAERIKNMRASQTVTIAAKAIALKEAGKDIIDFSVGEPDFPTPEHIKQAAMEAINANHTKYTANNGLVALRKAICSKLETENNVLYQPDDILVSNGAKHALFNVLLSVIQPGDAVLIPAPYWPSYPEIVKLAGGIPVFIETDEASGFHLSAKQLEKAVTPACKALLFCNPVNPTGAAYSKSQLEALAEVALKHNLLVISDEIYEKLIYDQLGFVSFASLHPKLKERTVVINGFSKAFAMTGWRVGYAAGPSAIIKAAGKVQSHSTSAASTISQYAAIAALQGPQEEIKTMVNAFRQRRDVLNRGLQAIKGITCVKGQGAFYAFPNISSFLGKRIKRRTIRNSAEFAEFLLDESGVVVVPGSGFGSDAHIRISYAAALPRIKEGLRRIGNALV